MGRLSYGARLMAETNPNPSASAQQKLKSPYGPLLWILAPLIILVAYGLIWKF